jgi:hypothetical protein
LIPLDHRVIFLWGCIKSKVHEHRPKTNPDLKEAIVHSISAIPNEVIEKAKQSFRSRRLEQCVACGGGHLKNVIF